MDSGLGIALAIIVAVVLIIIVAYKTAKAEEKEKKEPPTTILTAEELKNFTDKKAKEKEAYMEAEKEAAANILNETLLLPKIKQEINREIFEQIKYGFNTFRINFDNILNSANVQNYNNYALYSEIENRLTYQFKNNGYKITFEDVKEKRYYTPTHTVTSNTSGMAIGYNGCVPMFGHTTTVVADNPKAYEVTVRYLILTLPKK